MSFTNPVNEPVLRFSSTDTGAPPINYNARTAGDVKAVLKACLVTGYGTTSSAGWSIVNEVDHVCEFVSPSAAMSDYRLGIDDTSTSSTTWYYRYQDSRINPTKNTLSKSINYIDKSSVEWHLFVSARGMYFIESFLHSSSNKRVQRILWLGQLKSALFADAGINMSFFQTGYSSSNATPTDIFTSASNYYTRVDNYQNLNFETANISFFKNLVVSTNAVTIDVVSDVFLVSSTTPIAQQPGLQTLAPADISSLSSGYTADNQYVALAGRGVSTSDMPLYSKPFLIATDYWGF